MFGANLCRVVASDVSGDDNSRTRSNNNDVGAAVSVLSQLHFPTSRETEGGKERITGGRDRRGEMAEARSEEEEENMRDTREQVVRRQPNSSGGKTAKISTHFVCFEVIPPDIDSMFCSLWGRQVVTSRLGSLHWKYKP